jgi:hypothetical protein
MFIKVFLFDIGSIPEINKMNKEDLTKHFMNLQIL